MKKGAWVLMESDTGKYRCQNMHASDSNYYFDVINAKFYNAEVEAQDVADRMNDMTYADWLMVLPVTIEVGERRE